MEKGLGSKTRLSTTFLHFVFGFLVFVGGFFGGGGREGRVPALMYLEVV